MNKTVIVIGNGTTTRILDDYGFKNIPDNIDTIGMGMAHRHYERIGWFPTMYGQLDSKVVKHQRDEYVKLMGRHPEVLRWYFSTKQPNSDIGPTKNVVKCSPGGTGIGLAHKMVGAGYKTILVIGVEGWEWDLSLMEWLEPDKKADNRARLTDAASHNKNYFCDYYHNGDIISYKRGGGRTDPEKIRNQWKAVGKKQARMGGVIYSLNKDCALPFNLLDDTLKKVFENKALR